MLKIPIIELFPADPKRLIFPAILRMPYQEKETLIDAVNVMDNGNIYGILAPYSSDSIEFNIRCAARVQDAFPTKTVYTTPPFAKARNVIKTLAEAGFKNIAVPYLYGKQEYTYCFQFVEERIMKTLTIHSAGGKFSETGWQKENWTYSEEQL